MLCNQHANSHLHRYCAVDTGLALTGGHGVFDARVKLGKAPDRNKGARLRLDSFARQKQIERPFISARIWLTQLHNDEKGDTVESFSIWHWIVMLFWVPVVVVPCWRIVSKAGYAGGWSLVMLVPMLNLIMLWVFAFTRWPNEKRSD